MEKDDYKKIYKTSGKFISIAWFKAYDRELQHCWITEDKPYIEQIELKILDICSTAVIHEIKIIPAEIE